MERLLRNILLVSSVALTVLVILFAATIWTTRARYCVLFIMLSLIISTCSRTLKADTCGLRRKWTGIVAIIISSISVVASMYFYSEYVALLTRASDNNTLDFFFGVMLLVPIFLLIWKEGGSILTVLIGILLNRFIKR